MPFTVSICGHDLFFRALTGSIVAPCHPMHEDGSVDYPALRKLIDWHIVEGTDCIGVVGTTGESPTVNVEEHCEIIRVAVEQAPNACPSWLVAVPTDRRSHPNWPSSPRRSAPTASLQVVPYYNKPTQEGQYQHFKAVAEAVGDLPIILYNVPGRSVADMQHDTVLRLAQVPGIIGIKEATGNIERAQWLIREAPKGFGIYSATTHRRRPDAVRRPWQRQRHSQRGPKPDARAVCGHCGRRAPGHGNPVPADARAQAPVRGSQPHFPWKWAVARMGLCGGTLRLPMTPLSKSSEAVVEARCAPAACSEPRPPRDIQGFPVNANTRLGLLALFAGPVRLLTSILRRQDRLQKAPQGSTWKCPDLASSPKTRATPCLAAPVICSRPAGRPIGCAAVGPPAR